MTYYSDLSPYVYSKVETSTVNVGWLDSSHPFPTGKVTDEFLARLWLYCAKPVHPAKGFHECPFCVPPLVPIEATRGKETLLLGAAEIRVLGSNKKYAAPNLVYHYIVEHEYLPPEEFIQAVMEGPQPGTSEFEEYLPTLARFNPEKRKAMLKD